MLVVQLSLSGRFQSPKPTSYNKLILFWCVFFSLYFQFTLLKLCFILFYFISFEATMGTGFVFPFPALSLSLSLSVSLFSLGIVVAAVVDIHFILYIFFRLVHLLLLAHALTIRFKRQHVYLIFQELRNENRSSLPDSGNIEISVANNNRNRRMRQRNEKECQKWNGVAKEIARVVCIGKLVLNKYQIICPKEG